MKKFLLLAIFLASSVAVAGSARDLEAERLFKALESAGLYSDCGMGHCYVEAEALMCLMKGNSVGKRSYKCDFTGLTETGEPAPFSIDGGEASQLYKSLLKAGVPSDCGAGTCGMEAQSVHCRRTNDLSPGQANIYQCDFAQ